MRPQDPYATAKWFGELLCDRAVERADIRCTSIRPSWVQDEGSYERNLGPIVRDPAVLIANYCSYVDVYDLCDAVVLAIETDLPGHEVFYIASPDTIGGHPLAETVRTYYDGEGIEIRPLAREDASGISSAKAERLLGWSRSRSWRDYLDERGAAARMRTRRLGSVGAGAVDRRLRVVGRRRAVEVRLGAGRRRRVGRRDPARGRARRQLGRHRRGLRARPLRGGRRPGARAVPRRRGRLRLHQVRAALARAPGRRDRERPAPRLDPRGVRGEPAPPGGRADRPLPVPLARLDDRDAARGVLGDDGRARRRGQGALDRASRNFDVEQLERCEAIRHVDSVQPPLSLLARGARTTVVPWAARARDGRDRLLADGLGHADGSLRPRADRRASTPTTGAATRRVFSEPLLAPQPRARRATAADRRAARRRRAGARGRVDARAAGRHRCDRRRPSAARTSTAGCPRRSSSSATTTCVRSTRRSPRPAPGRTSRPCRLLTWSARPRAQGDEDEPRHLGARADGDAVRTRAATSRSGRARRRVERVRRAVEGLGDLIDDYEFHYPQELSPENLDEVRTALERPRHLLHRDRPPPRPALRPRRALLARRRATRAEAVRRTLEAADFAGALGAHFIIWPGIEGYNYPFQTPYAESWAWLRRRHRPGGGALRASTASSSSSSTRTPSRR